MTLLTAGFVDGSRVPAEILRRLAYAATKGQTAVVLPGDLKVTQYATAGAGVNVAPGTGIVVSAFANAPGQSYVVANDATLTVSVPTSAGTWYVYAQVRDPQYPGQSVPPNPLTDSYSDIAVAQSYPSNQPYMPLARIDNPGGAAAITNAMITDLRYLGQPRSERKTKVFFPATNVTMPAGTYGDWADATASVVVPPWATYLKLIAHINGLAYSGSDNSVAGVRGMFAGTANAQNGIIGSKGASRQSVVVLADWNVASNLRGTTQTLKLQGNKTAGSGAFSVDYQAQVVFDWEFNEVVG